MKKVILFICILLSFFASFGQRKILNVPLFPQLTDSWCWAASIQMIANYHGIPTTSITSNYQQKLAIINFNLKVPYFRSQGYRNANLIYDTDIPYLYLMCNQSSYDCTISSPLRYISRTILRTPDRLLSNRSFCQKTNYSNDGNLIGIFNTVGTKTHFEYILANKSFNSSQIRRTSRDSFPTSWFDMIKSQIDLCLPVIIIEGLTFDDNVNGHVVVGSGYKILPNLITPSKPLKLIVIKDPSFKVTATSYCNAGQQYLVDESYFTVTFTTSGSAIMTSPHSGGGDYRIISMVSNIKPLTNARNCASSGAIIENDTELDKLARFFQKPNVDDSQNILLRTISPNLTKNIKITDSTLSIVDKVVYDNVSMYKYKDGILYFYDMIDDTFKLTKISKDLAFEFEPLVNINKSIVEKLNNNGFGTRFELIEYPILKFQFYRFKSSINNQWYLSPIQNYFLKNKKLIQKQAYPEFEILSMLNN